MAELALVADSIELPRGAWARTVRHRLRHGSRTVLALTQGAFRPYVYPLLTPAGHAVTAEAPADHPHHASLWIAADHVHALVPAAAGGIEAYAYNFYVDQTFQGRAPGRLIALACAGRADAVDRFVIRQPIDWRGPPEWAAETGRSVAHEERLTTVTVGERWHRLDVVSRLAAREWALELGPTRHAYFNVRVADSLAVANGGVVRDDRGRLGGAAISGEGARWVDFTGPVGGGARAGITVLAGPAGGRAPHWFVADWGVVTVGPFRAAPVRVDPGEAFEACYTVLVHDGDLTNAEIDRIADV